MRWGTVLAAGLVIALAGGAYFVLFDKQYERRSVAIPESPKTPAKLEPKQEDTTKITQAAQPPVSARSGTEVPLWALVALLAMAVATSCAVIVSFYLYHWRRILLANPHSTVPEQWAKYLQQVGDHVRVLEDGLRKGIGHLDKAATETSTKIAAVDDSVMIFRKALDERESEIQRFKSGYDAAIFRRFLTRFIRIDQSLEEIIEAGTYQQQDLLQIKRMFEDALDQCGVEAFAPVVGADYRNAKGVADNPKKTKASEREDDFKICEILEGGYRLKGGEVIVPAKVGILVFGERE